LHSLRDNGTAVGRGPLSEEVAITSSESGCSTKNVTDPSSNKASGSFVKRVEFQYQASVELYGVTIDWSVLVLFSVPSSAPPVRTL
jgi:hypothetical protein